jgi:hypothetical protein
MADGTSPAGLRALLLTILLTLRHLRLSVRPMSQTDELDPVLISPIPSTGTGTTKWSPFGRASREITFSTPQTWP